ncbi:SusE domain-containing protein [Halosquirtibacter xylanolyticus]|uniref:SusE domain-containing protein n=1 Tax=Halosquirtibacter xylanolyticus TaxID=3374599 RepID=UPI00374921A7|nr:SusE domain-containing protein [Prolixibacteraceae bacterium]
MRKNLIYTVFAALMIFFSCSKIDRSLTLNEGVAPVLQSPTGEDREYVLTEENQNNPFETFIYTAADYGTTIAAKYTIEVDTLGGDFSTPVASSTSSTQLFQTISTKDFNQLVNIALKRTPEVQHDVQVRMRAEGEDPGVEILYSNVVTLKVTPYDATIPPLYIVGNAVSEWEPSDGVEMPATDVNKFKVTVDIKGSDQNDAANKLAYGFRFLYQNTAWDPGLYYNNDKNTGFDVIESIPAGSVSGLDSGFNGDFNFQVAVTGKYTIEINLDNDGKKTIKFTKIEE